MQRSVAFGAILADACSKGTADLPRNRLFSSDSYSILVVLCPRPLLHKGKEVHVHSHSSRDTAFGPESNFPFDRLQVIYSGALRLRIRFKFLVSQFFMEKKGVGCREPGLTLVIHRFHGSRTGVAEFCILRKNWCSNGFQVSPGAVRSPESRGRPISTSWKAERPEIVPRR